MTAATKEAALLQVGTGAHGTGIDSSEARASGDCEGAHPSTGRGKENAVCVSCLEHNLVRAGSALPKAPSDQVGLSLLLEGERQLEMTIPDDHVPAGLGLLESAGNGQQDLQGSREI